MSVRPQFCHLLLVLPLVLAGAPDAAAQTFVLTPGGEPSGGGAAAQSGSPGQRPAPDFATAVMGDPWDFEQATDYVYMFSLDESLQSSWNGIPTVQNGVFRGVARVGLLRLQMLFEGVLGALNLGTKNGVTFPIDTGRYRRLSFRMRRSVTPPRADELFGAVWSTDSVRTPATVGGQMFLARGYDGTHSRRYHNQSPVASQGSTGWHIYKVDLDARNTLGYGALWSGTVRGLRLELGNAPELVGATVEVDWVRLTERGSALATLSFSGFGGPVTVTAQHQETGDIIQIFPDDGTSSTTFPDNSTFLWDYGFLPPGTWIVSATRLSRTVTQTLVIDAPPVIELLDPDAAGGRDYGRAVVGDAYDLTNAQDVARDGWTQQLTSVAYGETGLTATTIGNAAGPPDPVVCLLDDSTRPPGTARTIDANVYRHLTFTIEYDRKDLPGFDALQNAYGGIVRVIWRADGKNGAPLTNTQDIFVLDGGPTTYSFDLGEFTRFGDGSCADCHLEAGHGTDLWQGLVSVFRIDPYESDVPRWFRLHDVRIAADDEPDSYGTFVIRWRVADATFTQGVANGAGADATVALYYDSDRNPATGRVLIASGLSASLGSYRWSVAGLAPGRYYIYAVVTDAAGSSYARYSGGPVRVAASYSPPTDANANGVPDAWESRHGITNLAADDDGDGVSNLDEYLRGTHPRLPNTWYLPEGATGFFTERIALANPDADTAQVSLTFLRASGSPIVRDYTVPPYGRVTVTVNDVAGLSSGDVSTVVRASAGGVVAERTMFWGDLRYGGHTGKALQSARTSWFLAEGSTYLFDTWILLANATSSAANVRVRYLLEGASPIERTYIVDPNSRYTIYANGVPGLANRPFSAEITSDVPIAVERAMYFSSQGRFWNAGHGAAAVDAPALEWFVAEGRTGPFFDTYLLLANPNPQAATATVRYLMPGGVYRDVSYTLPANSRTTLLVDEELRRRFGFTDTDVSAHVTATRPIVVERAMYWADGDWYEAHASAGVTAAGTVWALAEGEIGTGLGFDTFVLIANPGAQDARVRMRLLRVDAAPVETTFTVRANARETKWINTLNLLAPGERFGVLVESLDGVPIVVERAMYWNGGGQFWGGGTNETGVRLR
jgi:hypothetical protein